MILLLLSTPTRKVTVSGETTKYETCEMCGCEFDYVIRREADGEDKSLFSWTNRSANRKAADDACANLAKILEAELDPAPCPDCGWVQAAMIAHVRTGSYSNLRELSRLGLVLCAGGLLLALCSIPVHFGNFADAENLASIMAVVGSVIAAIGGIPGICLRALRDYLNSRYDPNRDISSVRD